MPTIDFPGDFPGPCADAPDGPAGASARDAAHAHASAPSAPRFFAVVAAGGSGSRMGSAVPKQYLQLGRQALLERALAPLSKNARIAAILVVVSPTDERAATLNLPARARLARVGGASRAESVRNGLRELSDLAQAGDFVVVHDAARPCLSDEDLDALLRQAGEDPVGGLLAVPIGDTVKQAEGGRSRATVDRRGLWRASTPQMFRYALLRQALDDPQDLAAITDEAAAVERLGEWPLLIAGAATNLKVTTPHDLELAQAILRMQGRW